MDTAIFEVYDEVWIMENNRPTKKVVFAVTRSMNYYKDGVEIYIHLVNTQVGAGWGNNEGIRKHISDVFTDKEAVIRNIQ